MFPLEPGWMAVKILFLFKFRARLYSAPPLKKEAHTQKRELAKAYKYTHTLPLTVASFTALPS